MTNEEKIEKMLKFFHGSRTLKDLLLEMAEWKEQQMIDKAAEWLEPIFKNLAGYNCGGDLINDFRRAMLMEE